MAASGSMDLGFAIKTVGGVWKRNPTTGKWRYVDSGEHRYDGDDLPLWWRNPYGSIG